MHDQYTCMYYIRLPNNNCLFLFFQYSDADVITIAVLDIFSLEDHYKILIGCVNSALSDSNQHEVRIIKDHFLKHLRINDSDTVPDSLNYVLDTIEKVNTPQAMWEYLVKSQFIHCLNTSLIREIFPSVSNSDIITQLVEEYELHLQKFLDQTDFILLKEILLSHPEYVPNITGCPKLLITLEEPFTSLSIHRWNQMFREHFSWSASSIFLANITSSNLKNEEKQNFVILEYLVLPIALIDLVPYKFQSHVLNYIGVNEVDFSDLKLGQYIRVNYFTRLVRGRWWGFY